MKRWPLLYLQCATVGNVLEGAKHSPAASTSMRSLLLSGCLANMSNLHLLAKCLLKLLAPGCKAVSSLDTACAVAGTVDFLRSLELDKDALTKAIIGTIGDIDSYQLPDAKGHTAFMRHLLKVTEEERQQRREQVKPAMPAAGTVRAAIQASLCWNR